MRVKNEIVALPPGIFQTERIHIDDRLIWRDF
jgi:hypothetical protein